MSRRFHSHVIFSLQDPISVVFYQQELPIISTEKEEDTEHT